VETIEEVEGRGRDKRTERIEETGCDKSGRKATEEIGWRIETLNSVVAKKKKKEGRRDFSRPKEG